VVTDPALWAAVGMSRFEALDETRLTGVRGPHVPRQHGALLAEHAADERVLRDRPGEPGGVLP
jgi:hypothetical protein